MTIIQVRLTVSPPPAGFGFTARGFVDALHGMLVKTCGGSCVGAVDEGVITLEARGAAKDELTSFLETYSGSFTKEGRKVEIAVVENPAAPLSASTVAFGATLNSAPVKLTKSFFMKLPPGTFLASNLFKHGFEPVFAETVDATETRAAQWNRIRMAGADQRACHTFLTEGHYRQWSQQQAQYFNSLRR